MSTSFAILKDPRFRAFFLSDIVSGFGVGMATIGANWFVLMKTGSNQYVGILLAVNVIAGFVASLFPGVITDKYNRKTVIFFTHAIRALFCCCCSLCCRISISICITCTRSPLLMASAGRMSASRSFLQEILEEKNMSPATLCWRSACRSECFLQRQRPGLFINTSALTPFCW